MNTTFSRDEAAIHGLVDQIERAQAAGRQAEAAQLLLQARELAPEHPLVLNAEAVQHLRAGNPSAARSLSERAVAGDDKKPAYWINLASACRGLGLREEEMAALQRALTLEPRHLLALLQKGSLLELQGKSRAAAKTYHHALQTIPPGAQLPGFLREAIGRAVQVVTQDKQQLGAFIEERLQEVYARHADADRERFEHCLESFLGRRRIYVPQPTFLHFPKLPALEFYPRAQFPWLAEVEAATDEIRAEFEQVHAQDAGHLEPYVAYPDGVPLDQWRELNHSRRWSVYYLWRDGQPIEAHLQRCPSTATLLARLPHLDIPNIGPTAFFSILDAKSHIPAHTGVTNTRLIVHVPLVVPPGCRFRVGSQTREWRPGEAWVFDDAIEHEAWNDSDTPRAVLIFDVWNPLLSESERDMVRAAVCAIRDYGGGESPLAVA